MLIKQKLPSAILKKLLDKFDLGTIKKTKPLPTSGNISYIVYTSKKKYLLRLSPRGFKWRSRQEIDAELEIINYLLKNKFPAPKPITAKNGERIIYWNNHFGYLREFINARPKLNPTPNEVNQFGELLGRFHNLVLNYRTKHTRKHIWDLKETRKNFKQDKKMILNSNFAQKEKYLKRFAKEISALHFPASLPAGTIHEDLGKRHVLWRKNRIIGIIDFDRSYFGKLILDLGQAGRGWCFVNNWEKWSNNNFHALINGYQRHRKLTTLEKKYLVDAIKFGILERSQSFCRRSIQGAKDLEDAKYARHSISKNGLLEMAEKNRAAIEKFLSVS